jgi:hypothetical protein
MMIRICWWEIYRASVSIPAPTFALLLGSAGCHGAKQDPAVTPINDGGPSPTHCLGAEGRGSRSLRHCRGRCHGAEKDPGSGATGVQLADYHGYALVGEPKPTPLPWPSPVQR